MTASCRVDGNPVPGLHFQANCARPRPLDRNYHLDARSAPSSKSKGPPASLLKFLQPEHGGVC